MKQQFRVLIGLLFFSNTILLCIVFSKKNTPPPVYVVFNGKNAGYTEVTNAGNSNFWDNYPYAVLTSEKRMIDSNLRFTNHEGLSIHSFANKILYRYFANEKENDDFVWKELKNFDSVVVLLDSLSLENFLLIKEKYQINCPYLLLKQKKINLPCDELKKSYFFLLSSAGKIQDIYYPRIELPFVVEKYISYNQRRVNVL